MYNNRRDGENHIYNDVRKKKENLNSQRDFKINSSTVSPNPSGIRNKKPSRESILNENNNANSRKGLYRNHGHVRKTSAIDSTNIERPSFNQTSENIRRNQSERSERSDFKAIKDRSYISNKSNRVNINSGAKAKIKQMLGHRENIMGNAALPKELDKHTGLDQYSSSKRKSQQKIYEGVLEYNGKKLHKKSNSLKSDVMTKYFLKGGRNQSAHPDNEANKTNLDQSENHHVSNRQISSSQQRRNNQDDYQEKLLNLSGSNFNQSFDKAANPNVKMNSFLGPKTSAPIGMLNNSIDNRKNLNDKIMSKYKKSVGGVYSQNNSKLNNSASNDNPKSEYGKNYGVERQDNSNSFQGGKTSGLYEKFISSKLKKSNLIPSNSNLTKESSFPVKGGDYSGKNSANSFSHDQKYLGNNKYAENSQTGINNRNSKYAENSQTGNNNTGNNTGNASTKYSSNLSGKKTESSHRKTESMNVNSYSGNYGYNNAMKNSGTMEKNSSKVTSANANKRSNSNTGNSYNSNRQKSGGFNENYNNPRIVSSQKNESTNSPFNRNKEDAYHNQNKQFSTKSDAKNIQQKNWEIVDEIRMKERELPHFEKSKVIIKDFGAVKAFSVNTHQGTVRSYNEDRVSILLNAQQRFENLQSKGVSHCSMFGVYDGHGGAECCNFQKENQHNYLLNKYNVSKFEENTKKAFKEIDTDFLRKAQKDFYVDTSGSCAQVLLVVDSKLIFINVGDSRGIISKKNGQEIEATTFDHKPHYFSELQRIFKHKGELYRVSSNKFSQDTEICYAQNHREFTELDRQHTMCHDRIFGPWRVKPGGLSVSKTFGDIESKLPSLGGIENVVSEEPDISIYNIEEDLDYAFIACDGIFDVMSNEDVNDVIWQTVNYYKANLMNVPDAYSKCLGDCVNNVLKKSLITQSEDNVTAILVVFKDLFA